MKGFTIPYYTIPYHTIPYQGPKQERIHQQIMYMTTRGCTKSSGGVVGARGKRRYYIYEAGNVYDPVLGLAGEGMYQEQRWTCWSPRQERIWATLLPDTLKHTVHYTAPYNTQYTIVSP